MRDPQAETYFKEALAQFDEQSIDYNITFVLFCFIIILTWIIVKAMNDMHRLYFGGPDDEVWDQFKYLKDMIKMRKTTILQICIYVYNELCTFYLDQLNSENMRDLLVKTYQRVANLNTWTAILGN